MQNKKIHNHITGRNKCESEEISENQWDNIGSTTLLTNNNGEDIGQFLYTPFGEMWVEEASEVDISHITRFFTNQQYDKESGLYYMNARYYDPHLGSFITPDPSMSGLNHYAYCNSNPIRYTDPTGLDYFDPDNWGEGTAGAQPTATPTVETSVFDVEDASLGAAMTEYAAAADRDGDGHVEAWEEFNNTLDYLTNEFNRKCNEIARAYDEWEDKTFADWRERDANYEVGKGWKTNEQLERDKEKVGSGVGGGKSSTAPFGAGVGVKDPYPLMLIYPDINHNKILEYRNFYGGLGNYVFEMRKENGKIMETKVISDDYKSWLKSYGVTEILDRNKDGLIEQVNFKSYRQDPYGKENKLYDNIFVDVSNFPIIKSYDTRFYDSNPIQIWDLFEVLTGEKPK